MLSLEEIAEELRKLERKTDELLEIQIRIEEKVNKLLKIWSPDTIT